MRGRDELEIVLNKTGKETEEKYDRLARLDLALKYEEKEVRAFVYFKILKLFHSTFLFIDYTTFKFVAHANCQQKLTEVWYTGLRPVSKMSDIFFLLFILAILILLPFFLVAFIFVPKSKV